jgi:filamentous hemagglutinin
MQTSRPKDPSKPAGPSAKAKSVVRQEPRKPYELKPGIDEDWRGTLGAGRTWQDALTRAFEKTGVDRSEFTETKWGYTKDGKSFPVEYKVKDGPNRGAEVSIDIGHKTAGPNAPHIGWQEPGKGAKAGHILLDDVPVNG